jgi:glycosyltransferase involved in cell wall biosynthesis
MTTKNPIVSIGLPIFNSEKYLRESIDSILAQTFTDFELIISDNASTDSTEEICNTYAANDPRVRYCRNSTNIGPIRNHNRLVELSRGKYFRFAGYDDLCAPDLIAKFVDILEKDSSVILCYSITTKIDENGNQIELIDKDLAYSSQPLIRFQELVSGDHCCEPFYGLIRLNVLRKTNNLFLYADSDRTFLSELSLYGKYFKIPETIFFRRYHPQKSTVAYVDALGRTAWSRSPDDKIIKDYFDLNLLKFKDYLKVISRAPLPLNERMDCYTYIIRLMFLSLAKEWLQNTRRRLFLTRETFHLFKSFFTH